MVKRIHVLRDPGRVAEPVKTVSPDEEAHVLELADVALHNPPPDKPQRQAGQHAYQEHKKLKQELRDAIERAEKANNQAA